MARHANHFSSQDFNSSSPVGVFANSRSSGNTSSTNGQAFITQAYKRRKTSGLNSRFDRMMSAINRSPVKHARRRAFSNGSSVTNSSYDCPQSTIGAYSDHDRDSTSIKMHHSSVSDNGEWCRKTTTSEQFGDVQQKSSKPLPEWLSSTFSSLAKEHPLRLLPPKSPPGPYVDTTPGGIAEDTAIDPVFAFSPSQKSRQDIVAAIPHIHSPPVKVDATIQTEEQILGSSSPPKNYGSILGALPFSTPGLNSLTFQLNSHTSAMPRSVKFNGNLSNDTPVKSILYDGTQWLVPFSTPGPGVLPVLSTPPSVALYMPSASNLIQIPPNKTSLVHKDTEHLLSTQPSPELVPSLPKHSPPFLSVDPVSHSHSLTPDLPTNYDDDDISDYSGPYDDPYTDDSTSDPSLGQDAHSLLNLFTTPGGQYPPRSIYFDSPAEDPFDSDPSQPGYEVDYAALDFHWKPFDRKGTSKVDKISFTAPDTTRGLNFSDDNMTPHEANRLTTQYVATSTPPKPPSITPPMECTESHVFRFSIDNESLAPMAALQENQERTIPELKKTVFAPAPGIFISPLSEPKLPTCQDIESSFRIQPKSDPDPRDANEWSGSQISDDSIKSWGDMRD